jgi:hypothetical protein
MLAGMNRPVLEPAAQAFADATAKPPYLFDLAPAEGRKTVDDVQSPEIEVPGTSRESVQTPDGLSLTIFRPDGVAAPLPVVTAVRYQGVIHDFVMLNALRGTHAAEAAITQAIGFLRQVLGTVA